MTRRWQDVVHDDEPLTISPDVVAEYLEQRHKPRMAALVRHLGSAARAQAEAEQRLRQRIYELEPKAPTPAADGGPRWTGD